MLTVEFGALGGGGPGRLTDSVVFAVDVEYGALCGGGLGRFTATFAVLDANELLFGVYPVEVLALAAVGVALNFRTFIVTEFVGSVLPVVLETPCGKPI